MATATRTEQYIDLTNARTRYIEAGTGDDHLILLHGMGIASSADSFEFVIDDLAQRYHILSLDQLGYGKGTRTIVEGPTFDLTVDHVREFMDARGIARASFVGHSAGGWTAALLAYESPGRVNKLVMVGSAGLNVAMSAGVAAGAAAPKLPTLDELIERNKGQVLDASKVPAERFKAVAESQLEMVSQPGAFDSLRPIMTQMGTPEVRQRYLLQRRMPHIKVPTLMVWGVGDVMDPYPTWNEEYEKLGGDMHRSSKPWAPPGAKFKKLNTGHSPQLEDPEVLLPVLLDFLKG